MTYTQALAAEQALDVLMDRLGSANHRVWVGREKVIRRNGGSWNPDFIQRYWEHVGGVLEELPFEQAADCPEHGPR